MTGTDATARARPFTFAVLALSPLAAAVAVKAHVWPRPYWAYFYDPEVVFFYSGIDLAEGRAPSNVQHPGTPLQIVGAAVAAATGTSPFDVDGFRIATYWTALALTGAALAALRATVLRSLPLPLALACAWTYFLGPAALARATIWSPETLFLCAGGLTIAALDRAAREPHALGRWALAGAAVGACVALKFTFAVFAVGLAAALFVAARRSGAAVVPRLAAAAVATIAGFVAATLPAAGQYPQMFDFVTRQLTRGGMYGAGEEGAPSAANVAGSFSAVLGSSRLWHAWLVLALAFAAWAWLRGTRDPARRARAGVLVAFGLVVIVAGYGAIVRSGLARYLLPTCVALVAVLGAAASLLDPPASRRAGWAALAACAAFLGLAFVRDLDDHRSWTQRCDEERREIAAALSRLTDGDADAVVVHGRRSPDPAYPLGVFASTGEQRDAVHAQFPRTGWHDPWAGVVHLPPGAKDWDWLVVREAELPYLTIGHGPVRAKAGPFVVLARR